MKILNKFSILCFVLLLTICFGQTAFAAKTLNIGTDSVNNTGTETERTATLDVTLKGGAHDVNGLVFTLSYNKDVFTFEGLVEGSMPINDGSNYDPENPPSAATIASTLYYQANHTTTEGIVMIAAAAANFFTDNAPSDFIPFRAKFRVKSGIGNGPYNIVIQKTLIGGPDTAAANAGYDVPTELEVAAGLDPEEDDPTTAQTYAVEFVPGQITVTGGYDVTGTVMLEGSVQSTDADGVDVNLIQSGLVVASETVEKGAYTFTSVPNGTTYKVEVVNSNIIPGYQTRSITSEFVVAGEGVEVDPIILVKYEAKSGTLTINNGLIPSGLRVEVRYGDTVIAVALDADGNFVTPALPDTYAIYAVYGSSEFDITDDLDLIYDWTLSLGTVSGTITGLCDDQEVEVFIKSETTKLQKSIMITGAGGSNTYELSNLLPGTDYILSMTGEGVGPVYYDGTEDFSSATHVVVEGNNAVTADRDFAFTCGDLVTISGTLTVDDSTVSGATVKANNFDFTNYKNGSAVTDAEGVFEIKVAKSDDYYVYFDYNGQFYYYESGVTQRSEATLVDVSEMSTPDPGIDFQVITVQNTATLKGYVTLNDGGIPLKDYLVALFTTDNEPLPYTIETDVDGYYLFENMPSGSYNVGLLPPPPYTRQFVEGVPLVNDSTTTVNFIVNQNYKITGKVMDADVADTPVVTARVDILKSDGSQARSATYTDSLGAYTLVEIPSGVYTLVASHKEYFPKSQEATVLSDLDLTDTPILMTKGAIIEGVVSDNNDVVVAGATVTLAGDGYVKSVKTDTVGAYQFRGLAAGYDHIIKAAKGTLYAPYGADPITTGDAGSTVAHDMTLTIPSNPRTFGGTVVMEGGPPVADAYVKLSSAAKGYIKVVWTNASGEFTFSNVIDGTDYSLLVLPGDGNPEIEEHDIAINENITAHVVTVLTGETISGTITLSEADANAIVIAGAYDPDSGIVHQVSTLNPSEDNQTFTYTIKVVTGVGYSVFAQDLTGTFPLKYYISGPDSGTYAHSTPVFAIAEEVYITLTKN